MSALPRLDQPLAHEIRKALRFGSFVTERRSVRFVEELAAVRADIMHLTANGKGDQAAALCDVFLDACVEKSSEIDDSGGELGGFMGDVLCDWIQAHESAGNSAESTAVGILARMDADDYGYSYRVEPRVADALSDAGRTAEWGWLQKVAITRCSTLGGCAGLS